jgi:hypothetical protein
MNMGKRVQGRALGTSKAEARAVLRPGRKIAGVDCTEPVHVVVDLRFLHAVVLDTGTDVIRLDAKQAMALRDLLNKALPAAPAR